MNIAIRIFLVVMFLFNCNETAFSKKPFTFQDAMNFNSLIYPSISNDGNWISYTINPDRGDGKSIIQSLNDTNNLVVERGSRPIFSEDSKWVAMAILPKSLDIANIKPPAETPKSGMALLRIVTGKITELESVKSFQFTNDSQWLLYNKFETKDEKSETLKKKKIGSVLIMRHLSSGTEIPIANVTEFFVDSTSSYLFYAISSVDGKRDGVYLRKLKSEYAPEISINTTINTSFTSLAWNKEKTVLAYIKSELRKDGEPDKGTLYIWEEKQAATTQIGISSASIDKDWFLPAKNNLKWTDDGAKLFFGLKPVAEKDTILVDDLKFTDSTFSNIDSILYNADEQIWHWNDPKIGTHQKKWWNDNKDRTFAAVFDLQTKRFFKLGNDSLTNIPYTANSKFALAYNQEKYSKKSTYDGFYYDLYLINLDNGDKTLIAEKISEPASISPKGAYSLFFKDKHWYLVNNETKIISNITQNIPIPFYDVDNDVPMEPSSYGVGGWFEDEKFVFINEKYDIYKFLPSQPGSFINATATVGRKNKIIFRIANIDKDKKYFNERDTIFMHGYSEDLRAKNIFFFETHIAGGIDLNVTDNEFFAEKKNYTIVRRSKFTNKLLYKKESFEEFPDLWVGDLFLDTIKKVTDANPQIKDFIWGYSEPYEWITTLGDTVKGFLIKPDDYKTKRKYPVLVYFYEKFSDQTYNFYQPRVNHRPIYQAYLGSGYVVFVPDITFKTGRPGQDAYDCIIPGLDLLASKGIIDKDKMVIQGHSWGGYQTAYLAAKTNLFKAAAAGAPVGNMTSAYSQIRTESGLARQFQYEKYQSRIGGNLWDSLNSYINNSPVFQLPKGGSPLLILHGNQDEAVPFVQGVELFLAYRRLDKPCVLIEYNNEPHHPRKYENKLDWQIKMKEWFDFYIFGKPAPSWITNGQPYFGK